MARKETNRPAPRPRRWKGKAPRPLVDSVWVGENGRREIQAVAKAYDVTLSEVVRTLVMAHAGQMDVAFEEHRAMIE